MLQPMLAHIFFVILEAPEISEHKGIEYSVYFFRGAPPPPSPIFMDFWLAVGGNCFSQYWKTLNFMAPPH